jgi:hypothetical protein
VVGSGWESTVAGGEGGLLVRDGGNEGDEDSEGIEDGDSEGDGGSDDLRRVCLGVVLNT